MLLRIDPKPKRTGPLHIRSKMNKNTIQRVQCLPFVGLSGSRAYFTCGTALRQSFYNITDLLAIPTREKHDIPRLNKKQGPASVKSRFDRRFPKTKGKKITQAIRSAHMSSRNPKRKRNADLIETKQTRICKLEREEMKRNRTKHSRAEAKNQCIRKSKCIPSLQAAEARSTKRDAALRK